MDVLLFGLAKSKATRKAQRFFSERRVAVAYHDLGKRAPTPGQLRAWVDRFGVEEVIDRQARGYLDSGLSYLKAGTDDWLERLAGDPSLIRLPLARCGRELAVGDDEHAWTRLASAAAAAELGQSDRA